MTGKHHENAIILAAGTGSRLLPLTKDKPKCMVELDGVTLLERSLRNLRSCGVTDVTLVLGYKGEVIRESMGDQYEGISLNYIHNPIYDQSNSMYSLWLARELLEQGAWILEGDVVCDARSLLRVKEDSINKAVWAGKPYDGTMDGSVLMVDGDLRVIQQEIIRRPIPGQYPHHYKSCGILCLPDHFGKAFAQWLQSAVDNQKHNDYYDLILAEHLNDQELFISSLGADRWYEIDTVDDLGTAHQLFA